jgi:hypothetical protein
MHPLQSDRAEHSHRSEDAAISARRQQRQSYVASRLGTKTRGLRLLSPTVEADMTSKPPTGRAAEPTLAESGLRVIAKNDGTWLEFLTTDGRTDLVRMEMIADELCGKGGTLKEYGEVIRRWCADQQHARVGRNP